MSQANIDLVRRAIDAYSRQDWEALRDMCDPEIEWRSMEALVGPGLIRGTAAAGKWLEDGQRIFENLHIDIERMIEREDRVVAVMKWMGRARRSGVTAEMHFAQVFTIRDGRLLRVHDYREPADALKAVGLVG